MSPAYIKILLLALPVVIYTQLISPLYSGGGQVIVFENNIRSSKALIPQYELALTQATELGSKASTLRKDYDIFDKDTLTLLNKIIPRSVNEIMIQDEFAEYVKESGITIVDFSIGKSISTVYPELSVYSGSITFSGSYEDFKKAIHFVETNLRYLDITSLDFAISQKDPNLSSMKLSFQTFYLK